MFVIELICSDPRCDAEVTVWMDELGEVDVLACECGHGFVAVRIEGAAPSVAVV